MSSSAQPTPTSVEDFLNVDSTIPGQNYVCISFLSPEKVLKRKENYFYMRFVNHLLQNRERLLNKESFNYDEVTNMIEDFRVASSDEVDREFDEQNNFQTSIRGVKIRGVYDTLREAQFRSEQIRKRDPNHNVFVGQVGYWLPWDPEFHKVQDVNYQETHLNELMKKYNENIRARDEVYNEETRRRIQLAKEEGKVQKADGEEGVAEATAAADVPVTRPVSEEDARRNISELRDIVDEKDRMFESIDPWTDRKNISKK
jgi:hypothetical protein